MRARIETDRNMPRTSTPQLFVVDGSNIATEGRSQPSLEQLNDAVLAFIDEHPKADITVVVDATFGHRIAKKESKAFDEAVANNELVTPPAGAIGRGDAFVLSIANKANAGVLSNDSFQEFHGDYDWLFDEGRLIGGKPVPHVGWVFVNRTPVRGPKSRQSVKEAKHTDRTDAKQKANQRVRPKKSGPGDGDGDDADAGTRTESPSSTSSASTPAPTSGRGRRKRSGSTADAPTQESTSSGSAPSKEHVNELMPFLEFVENHPVGTSCTAQVETYASHGAYARTGDVLIYIPLRLMDEPAPRSARSALTIGDAIAVVIVGFTPDRRSIDAALPHMAGEQTAAREMSTADSASKDAPAPRKTTARRSAASNTAAKKTRATTSPAKKSPATTSPAKKTPAKKTPAKKTPAKKTPAKKTPAKKTPAKKTPAKKTPAKKTPAKKTPAKTAPAKKAPAKKAPAKSPAKSPATTAARKTPAKTGSRKSSS